MAIVTINFNKLPPYMQTGLPIEYSETVALTVLPIGFTVIVVVTGFPIGYSKVSLMDAVTFLLPKRFYESPIATMDYKQFSSNTESSCSDSSS